MRVAVISANLGGYDAPNTWPALIAPYGMTVDVHRFTDENFPPRPLAMTSRLQCGMLKMLGPQFVPGYDVYLWIDASCAPTPNAITWFLDRLGNQELVVFKHPERNSIREEYQFIKARMTRPGEQYLNSRYRAEWIDEQFAEVMADTRPEACRGTGRIPSSIIGRPFVDNQLFASTALMYRPTHLMSVMGQMWWYHKTRFLLHDQLSLPYVIWRSGVRFNVIPDSYLKCDGLTFTRKKR